MRRSFPAAFVAAAALASPFARGEEFDLTVVSFNIMAEFLSADGVPPWSERRDKCVELLKEHDPDLVGLQEPTPRQVQFLVDALPGFASLHYPRYNYTDAALLYRSDRFELVESGFWWLSKTPDKPLTTGFGNTVPRLVVWALLEHRPTRTRLYAINTHFDNTMPSQVKMAALCQEKLAPMAEKGLPMIWMGDFNTDQKRGDFDMLVSNGWKDSYTACPEASPGGRDDNVPTFENGKRIDHIFHHGPTKAVEWRRLDTDPKLSDHYPILARIRVTPP